MEVNQNEKRQIHITVTKQDHDRLFHLAQQTGRTASGYIRWLLHEHFTNLDKERKES